MLNSRPGMRASAPPIISAISSLKFPFKLTQDQTDAVEAWIANGYKGSIIYSTGTGKTEIAFECAKRASEALLHNDGNNLSDINNSSFNILFLVPRIVLVQQNIDRLTKYGIPQDRIGAYFGERKEVREITISTYQSTISNLDLISNSDMIIFDEVHLVSDTATTLRKVFDFVTATDPKKPLLGLTATIDEQDPKYNTILSLLPPVRKYMIKDAVKDKRLARPVVIPIKVDLTYDEKRIYDKCSAKIRNISMYLNTSDPKSISCLLRTGGRTAGLARTWFANVKERKNLINCAKNKLLAGVDIIATKHPSERIMVFSETIESIQKLKEMLRQNKGIESKLIESKLNSTERQKILAQWGKDFFPLLSVHTLEIGYDVPEVRLAIILATSSNMNQIVQRIGRIIRKTERKDTALIYTIYLSQTHDASTLKMVRKATNATRGHEKKDNKNQETISVSANNDNLDRYY
ncbi:MAG TPA: DEAD/DEAH box helicase [Candidatus Nitrosopolaris sp.]|nr:DEAD/DEAH box helicase [Candidatus Nitrosopolaris sp.]